MKKAYPADFFRISKDSINVMHSILIGGIP